MDVSVRGNDIGGVKSEKLRRRYRGVLARIRDP